MSGALDHLLGRNLRPRRHPINVAFNGALIILLIGIWIFA